MKHNDNDMMRMIRRRTRDCRRSTRPWWKTKALIPPGDVHDDQDDIDDQEDINDQEDIDDDE